MCKSRVFVEFIHLLTPPLSSVFVLTPLQVLLILLLFENHLRRHKGTLRVSSHHCHSLYFYSGSKRERKQLTIFPHCHCLLFVFDGYSSKEAWKYFTHKNQNLSFVAAMKESFLMQISCEKRFLLIILSDRESRARDGWKILIDNLSEKKWTNIFQLFHADRTQRAAVTKLDEDIC